MENKIYIRYIVKLPSFGKAVWIRECVRLQGLKDGFKSAPEPPEPSPNRPTLRYSDLREEEADIETSFGPPGGILFTWLGTRN